MTLKPFYDRTEDVHVGAYVAYGHTDGKLYADAEHKMKVSAADLGRAFTAGPPYRVRRQELLCAHRIRRGHRREDL